MVKAMGYAEYKRWDHSMLVVVEVEVGVIDVIAGEQGTVVAVLEEPVDFGKGHIRQTHPMSAGLLG